MRRVQEHMKTKAHGANHDVTKSKTATLTETALHPSTPLEIMVSRAIDQELEWYFVYAESALHHERIGLLPSYAMMLVSEPTDAAIRSQALRIAHVVRGFLLTMAPRHAEVLRAVYTPRSWPKSVEKAWGSLSAIVVRLVFAEDPWPSRSGRSGLEQAAAVQLSESLANASVSVARLRRQARHLLRGAVVAYAGLRALEGVMPGVG